MALVAVKTSKTKKNLSTIPVLVDAAKEYARESKASETRRGYANDLKSFESFCQEHGVDALPATPQTVALYFTQLVSDKKAVATIRRHAVSIAQSHKIVGVPNPVADPHVREILKGIARVKGTAQHKKTALTGEHLPNALLTIDTSNLKGKRDKAMLLLTFFLAGRRSEVAALNLEDLRFEKSGLVVTIRRSKTDQTGQGREIAVPYVAHTGLCAVLAVQAWIESSGIKEGAFFRTFAMAGKGKEASLTANRIDPLDVARLVKRVTGKAGIVGDFSGHSLRAGFITTAAGTNGVSEIDIQAVSGHRSVQILRSYVRRANVFTNAPASAMFGAVGK